LKFWLAGRLKKGAFADLRDEYLKRMTWPVMVTEVEGRNAEEEQSRLIEKIRRNAVLIALDEKGKVSHQPRICGQPVLTEFSSSGADRCAVPDRRR
jgi:23S rRNA pseudoU1915 N3-methylase RlmH